MHVLLTGNTTFKLANFREGLIRRLVVEGHQVTVVAPPDEYVEKIRSLGCKFIPIKMDRNGTSPLAEARLLLSIFDVIRRLRPDVMFAYTIKNNIYGGIACRVLGVPFAPNVTGLGPAFDTTGLLNRTVRILYRFAFSKAMQVFFQNSSDLAIFSGIVPQDRVCLLPGSGVDLIRFAASPHPDSEEGIRFLLVARLIWEKGIGVYVDAARKVRETFPQARFQLLGPLDPDSKSGVSKAQVDEWVSEGVLEYLGSTQDVMPYLQAAHCVVLPSYYREGTPRSLLEAGAMARPIITTNSVGCRDTVEDGVSGFLCAPRSPESLAEKMMAFCEMSPVARHAMGRAGRAHIELKFDETIVLDKYLAAVATLSCASQVRQL